MVREERLRGWHNAYKTGSYFESNPYWFRPQGLSPVGTFLGRVGCGGRRRGVLLQSGADAAGLEQAGGERDHQQDEQTPRQPDAERQSPGGFA